MRKKITIQAADPHKSQVKDPVFDINRLNMRQMQCFVSLAQTLHFGLAAKQLNMSQSALSRQIKLLEVTFGLQLAERDSHTVRLTEVGEVMLESCRTAFAELQTGLARATRLQMGKEGCLHLGYNDFAINTELTEVIAGFADGFPDIVIESFQGATESMFMLLKEHQLDIAFGTGPICEAGIESLEISRNKLVALMSSRHPLANRKKLYLEDFQNEPFIFGTEQHWRQFLNVVNKVFARANYRPKISARTFNMEGIFGLVSANLGVTFYPDSVVNYARKNMVVRQVEDMKEEIQLVAFWRKSNRYKPLSRFLEMVRQAVPFDQF